MRKVDPAKHEGKRQEVLDAASRCFGRSGFRGASIAQVCTEAKMSAGHLYHYFPSKEAIVEAMIEANLARAATLFAETVEGKTVVDALITLAEQSSNAPLLFDMLAEASRTPSLAKLLHAHSAEMSRLMVELLRCGQARGEVDPSLDPERVAPVLIGLVDGLKALHLRSPRLASHGASSVVRTLFSRFLTSPRLGEAERH